MSHPQLKIYKSSAGSGKTYQLVLNYLSIILKDQNPDKFKKILAITFTNKAANEMKERIISGLTKLVEGKDERFLNDYFLATGIPPHELSEKASILLSRILHNYGHLNILTIDKFVHKVIRSFSRELGLSSSFELAFDFDDLLARCIDDILKDLGENKVLTQTLIEYYQNLIDSDENPNIEYALTEQAKVLKNEDSKEHLNYYNDKDLPYFNEVRKKLLAECKVLRNEMLSLKVKLEGILGEERNNLKIGTTKYFASILDDLQNNAKTIGLSESQRNNVEAEKWIAASKEKTHPNTFALINAHSEEMKSLFLQIDDLGKKEAFLKLVDKNLMGFALLTNLQHKILEIKKENNLVLIGELNQIISKIILSEPAPFIYEKIGNRFENYFIDEFQDTSTLQWMNLIPLFHDSLSKGFENLIVGDAKQAIYRWRGGDAQQFVDLPKVTQPFTDQEFINSSFSRAHQPFTLNHNYRSSTAIIDFNNWLFDSIIEDLNNDKIKEVYHDVTQQKTKTDNGLVSVSLYDLNKEAEIKEYLQILLNQINECREDNFNYKDICILTRRNKEGAEIAQFLVKNNIPITSQDSLLLSESPQVQLIFHLMKAINQPTSENVMKVFTLFDSERDVLSLYEQYRIPASDEFYNNGFDFNEFLKNELTGFSNQEYSTYSLFDKVDLLIRLLKFSREELFIDKFLNLIFEFQGKNGQQINRFIEYFEDNASKISIAAPDGNDAIKIMTIHKSKGLQFPVVMIPKQIESDKQDAIWVKSENLENIGLPEVSLKLSEKSLITEIETYYDNSIIQGNNDLLNMIYVAFTRAETRLYLSFRTFKKSSFPNNIHSYIESHPNYNSETRQLVLGAKNKKPAIQDKSVIDRSIKIDTSNTETWRTKLLLCSPNNDDQKKLITLDERTFGIAIHEILQKIEVLSHAEEIVFKYLKKHSYLDVFKEEILSVIKSFTEHPIIIDIYNNANRILSERSICTRNGEIFRPDKVIEKSDMIYVIDFKTGSPNEKFKQQIMAYAHLLSNIYHLPVKSYLIYLSKDKTEVIHV
ncbi:MAG: UvrD-helicase domain-containing protein [Flavobacteriales bacterium]|nr:UvrD-helicase domain-containing protein [Flavobacteriales bacterium]